MIKLTNILNEIIQIEENWYIKKDINFAIDWIKDNSQSLYKSVLDNTFNEKLIYKGISSGYTNSKICITYPKTYKRKSKMQREYMLKLIDGLSSWNNFPKRSQSIICTSNANYTKTFGSLHVVIPKDDNDIVICNTKDFNYGAFEFALNKINDLFYSEPYSGAIESIDDLMDEMFFDTTMENYDDIILWFENKGLSFNDVNEMFSPEKASDEGFKIIKYSNYIKENNNTEIYTNSECLVIEYNTFYDEILGKLKR